MAIDGAGFHPGSYDTAFRNIEAAFRNIGVSSFILDEAFIIRDVNNAGLEFTNYSYNELIDERITIIADDVEVLREVVNTVQHGHTWTGDLELKTKMDKTIHGEGSVAPIRARGEKQGYVAVFIDTTKQRQFENAAEVLNRLLRHDLRNELQALYGSIQLAIRRAEKDEVLYQLEQSKDQVMEILNMSERARDLRTHFERTFEAANRPIRVDHALNEALVDPLNEFDDAEFLFGQFPEIRVVADDLLSIVFESVIENAVVHNDKDTPTVEVGVEEWDSDIIVSVGDNGPGIPDENKDLIFGREEEDHLHHGSGISLFFADTVIDSYNGDIWVEDNTPRGARFKIRLRKATPDSVSPSEGQ